MGTEVVVERREVERWVEIGSETAIWGRWEEVGTGTAISGSYIWGTVSGAEVVGECSVGLIGCLL